MSFTSNQVTSITVKDRNDNVKGVLDGKVIIKGGDGILVAADGDELTLNAGSVYNDENARYQRKFEVLINGGTFIDDDGTPMTFSGMPYYVSSVGGVFGNYLNNFDFLSNACGQVGIFKEITLEELESSVSASESSVSNSESESSGLTLKGPFTSMLNDDGELELLDLCPACVDCEDYAQIISLTGRIEGFQLYDVERNLDSGFRLFRQMQATIELWNHLCHIRCFPFDNRNALEQDKPLHYKVGYYNPGPDELDSAAIEIRGRVLWETEGQVGDCIVTPIKDLYAGGANPPAVVSSIDEEDDELFIINITLKPEDYPIGASNYMHHEVTFSESWLSASVISVSWTGTHIPHTGP